MSPDESVVTTSTTVSPFWIIVIVSGNPFGIIDIDIDIIDPDIVVVVDIASAEPEAIIVDGVIVEIGFVVAIKSLCKRRALGAIVTAAVGEAHGARPREVSAISITVCPCSLIVCALTQAAKRQARTRARITIMDETNKVMNDKITRNGYYYTLRWALDHWQACYRPRHELGNGSIKHSVTILIIEPRSHLPSFIASQNQEW
jgi:hypothetical protein